MHRLCRGVMLGLVLAACGTGDSEASGTSGTSGSSGGHSSTSGGADSSGGSGSGAGSTSGTGGTSGAPTTGIASGSSGEATSTGASTGGLPDGVCRSDADCEAGSFEFCFAPDEVNCGECQAPDQPCDPQTMCDPGFVCVPFLAPCACEPGVMQCAAVVTCGVDADCADDTLFCDPQQTCAVKTCDGQGLVCPPLFECVADAPGDHCVRRPCEGDDACDGGVCVEGRCFAEFGHCEPPAP